MGDFFRTYAKELVALAVPIVTFILNRVFAPKASLVLSNPHGFTFLFPQQQLPAAQQGNGPAVAPGVAPPAPTVQTRSYLVWNNGKVTATNVQWILNWKPLCINFWPPRHFEAHVEQDNRYVMIFDSIAPNEQLGCEIIAVNGECPNLLAVRSDQCEARIVKMYPQPVVANWVRRTAVILMLAGLGVIVYALIYGLQYLILKTPLSFS